jgi:hypothetical protein
MDSAIWVFIGAIVGAATSLLTTYINNRHAVRLQKETDVFKRSERAKEFQMNNLLELQESLLQHMRLVNSEHLEYMESLKKEGDWKRSDLLSKELDQEIMLSNRRLFILTERIKDNALRNNLDELHQKMNKISFAKSVTESIEILQTAATYFEQFMTQLGVVLRSNF